MSPLRFSKLKVLSDELVPSATPPEAEGKPSRALSDLDNSIFVIGYYGGGVASSETVDIPLLRFALSDALAKLPWFAGRFVMRQDGRLDVSCTNAGARLVVASTSSTLADLAGAISTQGPGYLQQLPFPFSSMLPVNHPTWVVKRKAPCCSCSCCTCRAGATCCGCCCTTPPPTSLPCRRWRGRCRRRTGSGCRPRTGTGSSSSRSSRRRRCSRISVAVRLACRLKSSRGGAAAATPKALPQCPRLQPQQQRRVRRWGRPRSRGRMRRSRARRTRCLRASPCAPRMWRRTPTPRPTRLGCRSGTTSSLRTGWRWSRWCGTRCTACSSWAGGVQLRQVLVPSSLLADLKRRANQELEQQQLQEQQQQQGEGVQEGVQVSGEQVADSRVVEEGPGGGAKQQQAGQAQGALRASSGVRWVSTNDALVARAMQVLHSLPLRRHLPFNVTVAGEMRRRLQPPLPAGAGQLGNLSYAVRVMDTWPANTSLGRMAAVVRYALTHWLTPQFVRCMAAAVRHVSHGSVTGVTSPMAVSSDPLRNVFSPTGPITVSNWDVDFGCWQFGRAPPLCFTPLLTLGPGVIIVHPSSPHQREQQQQQKQGQDVKGAGITAPCGDTSVTAGADAGSGGGAGGGSGAGVVCRGDKSGGVVLTLWLHNVAWRQLDAMGCSFGQLLKLRVWN